MDADQQAVYTETFEDAPEPVRSAFAAAVKATWAEKTARFEVEKAERELTAKIGERQAAMENLEAALNAEAGIPGSFQIAKGVLKV